MAGCRGRYFPLVAFDQLRVEHRSGIHLQITVAALVGVVITAVLATIFLILLNQFRWGGMAEFLLAVYRLAIATYSVIEFAGAQGLGQLLPAVRVLLVAAALVYLIRM